MWSNQESDFHWNFFSINMCLITHVFDDSLGTARPFNLFTSQFNSLTRLIKKGSELIWLLALLDLFRPKFCLFFYIYLMHFPPILPTTRKFMTLKFQSRQYHMNNLDYRLTFLFNKRIQDALWNENYFYLIKNFKYKIKITQSFIYQIYIYFKYFKYFYFYLFFKINIHFKPVLLEV